MSVEPHPAERASAVGAVRLQHLAVRDFRNLARLDLDFPRDGLALIGDNGQGKTNLLEAIYYLQLLRSFRGARDVDVVRFGEDGFHLSATLSVCDAADDVSGERQRSVTAAFARAGKRKRVRVDGMEVSRLADALGTLTAVVVSPHDAAIVSGAPGLRRRYLDIMLSLADRRYLLALQRYRGALARRNAALRAAATRGSVASAEAASLWEPALAEHGATLWRTRAAWVDEHADDFAARCTAIGERGAPRMRYVSGVEPSTDPHGALLDALAKRRAHDVRRGLTHAGPHRDDLELTIDGRELRAFGSAGQEWTAAIALRLLEAATLRSRLSVEPVMLLDDPFAELDVRRAARILELLSAEVHGQTILAVPRSSDIPTELTRLERWYVRDGAVLASPLAGRGGVTA
ncbi:MAG TPA: DNA replication and repair protein RecF [Gemmatimonadaceae bacterium]|nr:DNA replication and repair protein RecF [Gemmatimonadaceae bacterium]